MAPEPLSSMPHTNIKTAFHLVLSLFHANPHNYIDLVGKVNPRGWQWMLTLNILNLLIFEAQSKDTLSTAIVNWSHWALGILQSIPTADRSKSLKIISRLPWVAVVWIEVEKQNGFWVGSFWHFIVRGEVESVFLVEITLVFVLARVREGSEFEPGNINVGKSRFVNARHHRMDVQFGEEIVWIDALVFGDIDEDSSLIFQSLLAKNILQEVLCPLLLIPERGFQKTLRRSQRFFSPCPD